MELTQRELAAHLGLTTRQVSNLQSEGIPHRTDGRRKLFPVPEAIRWYIERKETAARASVKPTVFDEARAREMAARAELVEMEVARARRELLSVEDADRMLAARLAVLRAMMLALPGRLAAALPMPPKDAVDIIEPIVREMMQELADADVDDVVDDAG